MFCLEPPLGAYNSPVIGSPSAASVLVTAEAANGEIGFMSTQPITVQEPGNGTNQVYNLNLIHSP